MAQQELDNNVALSEQRAKINNNALDAVSKSDTSDQVLASNVDFVADKKLGLSTSSSSKTNIITADDDLGLALSIALNGGSTEITPESGLLKIAHNRTPDNVARIAAENTSFQGLIYDVVCGRAANSAYSFMRLSSGSGADLKSDFKGDGNNTCDGSWTGGGADYAICREWEDGNIDSEDRIGCSVIFLPNEKMRIAADGETPDGAISATYAYLENSEPMQWKGKYLKDDFGRTTLEDYKALEWVEYEVVGKKKIGTTHSYESDKIPSAIVVPENAKTVDMLGNNGRPVLNPDFDANIEFVSRMDRKEWDAVGFMGIVRVKSGQQINPNWMFERKISNSVSAYLIK